MGWKPMSQGVNSFKDSMEVPLAGLEDSEKPEAIGGIVFNVEVVAGFVVAVPPLAGEALGAGAVEDATRSAAMGEGDGPAVAVVGGSDDDGKLQGSWEEVEGTE